MLGQGTNRMNQGLGSDGSGWGSEWTGLVRAWWRLTEGSVKAAALAVEATAPAVNSKGSVRAQATADWDAGTLGKEMSRAEVLVALVTAAMEAGKLRERRRQGQSAAAELGASGLRWEGENVK